MTNYFLPDGYVSRDNPQHFDDLATAEVWQPGAYDLAFKLAKRRRVPDVVDIGCGNADKLRRFHDVGIGVIGYDAPATVERLKTRAHWMTARAIDLDDPMAVITAPAGALVICCDVVEHLRRPDWLLLALARLREFGHPIVISTPDRILADCAPLGPPINLSHAREWSMAEFQELCASFGLTGGEWSHTQTVSTSPACSTITGVFG